MERIEIQGSYRLRVVLAALWGIGSMLLGLDRCWSWGTQLLWLLAFWHWASTTFGINGRVLTLVFHTSGWHIEIDGEKRPLTAIYAGTVSPVLVTALLVTPGKHYALMVASDSTSADAHWRLRRLMLEGVTTQEKRAFERGT